MSKTTAKRYDAGYCGQNDHDCETCSLVNYGMDCHNNPIKDTDIYWWLLSIEDDRAAAKLRQEPEDAQSHEMPTL